MPEPLTPSPPEAGASRRVSRGPVVVLIIGAAAIVSLVLLGAALAGVPVARPQGTTPGTAENPRDVNVIMRDYHFDPTPLFLYAGETVRLHVFNAGMLEHELVLGNAAVQQAWDAADSRATPPAPFATAPAASVEPALGGLRLVLGSGQSADTLYAVPAAEAPQLLCHLPGHVEHGMVGEVVLVNH